MNTLNEEFINGVIEAILQGTTLPKTKKTDVILRVAEALHIFSKNHHVTSDLIQCRQPSWPEDAIEKMALLSTINYVGWEESHKNLCCGKHYKIFLPLNTLITDEFPN